MKAKKFFVYIWLVATGSILVTSCKKYLDVVPDNVATIDYAFRNRLEAEKYLFTCYNTLQQLSRVDLNPGFTTSGEVVMPSFWGEPQMFMDGFQILRGTQTAINPTLNFWDGKGGAPSMYQAIRRCNILIDNISLPPDLSPQEKKRWTAEAKFLKAYYHFWLTRMYGPIPVIRTNLPVSATSEEVRIPREHVDTVFNYVVALLDEAITDLPEEIQVESNEMGRITKTIARAVKAEVRVTQASPLFNGNPDMAALKDKEGNALFAPETDPKKWEVAVAACKEAIDACHAANYQLYHFVAPGNLGQVSDSTKLLLTLQNAVTDDWNDEEIWALNPGYNYQRVTAARLTPGAMNNYYIYGQFGSTINTAEMFYSNHGVPIEEDKTWNYAERFNLTTGNEANRFYVEQGYTTVQLHLNREPRFYASLGFDGGKWFGNGQLSDATAYHLQGRIGGPAGKTDGTRYNVSGYWPKKLIHYQTVLDENITSEVWYPWPVIRMAGLYLLYAEALNESEGPTGNALQWINQVRNRAGLENVETAWTQYSKYPAAYTTKDGLRKIIQHERRIELCFEGQAGWDLRRWKTMADVLSRPIQGWDIDQSEAGYYYRPRTILTPSFQTRDYFWPILTDNLSVNPKLVQNLYW
ncbi:RagB/SusD family nutrient uptake outer membrane protein [Flavihumibacter petaseus]|uniref:RagB/SusD family nutrient uptake outer membrane protein n=1 Tax=Flavihumibacter petaseus NBRC 106054 TaxID=1220578 RepID=A0A0E9N5N9_9BACT|nr:RagB/SusD family nutrient uptake outer membrane protein [Flavihumibacter petaseus]GAO44660.1 hypothetical protein FPE01S_03_06990 [Flavihumibacter petaseus NBRC 106054]